MKRLALACGIILLILFFCTALYWRLPSTTKITLRPLPTTEALLLLPLDSRPVCSELPQQLGALAGIEVILPSKELLDNYQIPADRKKLYFWLKNNLPGRQKAIISADLLIHGGLLHSRLPLGKQEDYQYFLNFIEKLQQDQPQAQLNSFVIVPRLLVSDQLLPDRWYQWHLRRYAELRDLLDEFSSPTLVQEMEEIAAQIPPKILAKYLQRYVENDNFNQHFLQSSSASHFTLIGQDDGASFGLPNRNMRQAKVYSRQLPQTALTYGADEIAALLVARSYLKQNRYLPKIYLHYARPELKSMYMPFMPASNEATLQDKIQLLGGQQVADPQQADILLYISCGYENYHPGLAEAEELRRLLTTHPHVALLDLSANFSVEELLVPQLLRAGVPLQQLSAYAGWNTFSNSAGTVLAQATIFAGQCQRLTSAELPQLYAANLDFTLNRLADDFLYQKLCHAPLRKTIAKHGYNPDYLENWGLGYGQGLVQDYLGLGVQLLLHANLGRTPFYRQGQKEYYLRQWQVSPRYPWRRVFEIAVGQNTSYGLRQVSQETNSH